MIVSYCTCGDSLRVNVAAARYASVCGSLSLPQLVHSDCEQSPHTRQLKIQGKTNVVVHRVERKRDDFLTAHVYETFKPNLYVL